MVAKVHGISPEDSLIVWLQVNRPLAPIQGINVKL